MSRIRTGAVVAIAAILFAACQGTATTQAPSTAPTTAPSTGASSAPSAPPSAAIKEGGTLVVGLPGDMVLADPSLVSDSNSSYIQLNVVEGLLGVKPGTLGEIERTRATGRPRKIVAPAIAPRMATCVEFKATGPSSSSSHLTLRLEDTNRRTP